jgi:DNA-binding response OmpR family regulator
MDKPIIVVADDDRALLDALKTRLGAAGFEVHAVQDGYMAVQAVRRLKPDVVLLDVGMPAGDGFSVQERVRHFLGDDECQFVYMTGSREAEVLREARTRHAYALVRKPFDGGDLVGVLRGAVRHRRARATAAAERTQRDAMVGTG